MSSSYEEQMRILDVLGRAEDATRQSLAEAINPGTPTGRCPRCDRNGLRLRKDGTLWNHRHPTRDITSAYWGQNCGGSGEPPATGTEEG